MRKFSVSGMSCAACSAKVEKAVNSVPGVTQCSVSLLTNSLGVQGDVRDEDIIRAVEAAGYAARIQEEDRGNVVDGKAYFLKDFKTPELFRRFIFSMIFLLILMYFSMGYMMAGFPLPGFIKNNYVAMGLAQLLLTVIIMIINQQFFISGFKGLIRKSPNMDTLVALGSGTAFIYSTYALFAMTDAQINGNMDMVMHYMDEFYFESAAMILTLITLGKTLEARAKGKTTDALKSLMKLEPQKAVVIRNGKEESISISQVKEGDLFVVKPGDRVAADGIVIEGESAVDESILTGESIPVDKSKGDNVSAATINQSGYLKCKAVRVGEDTTLSQIIKMVSDAASTKAPIAKAADKISGFFVPVVISISIVTFIVWIFLGKSPGFSLARAIAVLVISCPCALGLATPVAIMVGNGVGAKNGILFKTAASLEETGRVNIIAIDKTGTITKGEPVIKDIYAVDGNINNLMAIAYGLEIKSEHPLAKAVVNGARERNIEPVDVVEVQVKPGNGLSGKIATTGQEIYGGNTEFAGNFGYVDKNIEEIAGKYASEGKTPLIFGINGQAAGIISIADEIKEDSSRAIQNLKAMGIKVVMITGDNETVAKSVGAQAGVDNVIAGVKPDEKKKVIDRLKSYGSVAMVGDGINDAPALANANIGIAVGAGTDVAIDTADVVLMKSRISDVVKAICLSRTTLRNIHENLFWAFIYNAAGIPLAAGVFIKLFGWELNPMFAAAAMSLSSFCVISNALRLNFVNLENINKFKRKNNKEKNNKGKKISRYKGNNLSKDIEKGINKYQEKDYNEVVLAEDILNINDDLKKEDIKTMEKIYNVEGMMCEHCEATVKKALEAIDGVESAVASHTEGRVTVKFKEETGEKDGENLVRSIIEGLGYKFR